MLKEALELIQNTAVKSEQAKELFSSRNKQTATYCVNGEVTEINLGIEPRCHRVDTLNDLVHFVKTQSLRTYSIWHDENAILLLCDDASRHDKVQCKLMRSCAAEKLSGMASGDDRFSQPDFIRLLHRTFQVDASIVSVFRKLDFKVVQAATGEYQHGKDRIGKSVQAEITGTNAIPEEINISVPLYTNKGERCARAIMLDVDLDAQRSQIICAPKPGELEIAYDACQTSIRERLLEALGDGIKVYQGEP